MTTLSTLRARIRLSLASTGDWPNATLDAWIADAIRLYSASFPRQEVWYANVVAGDEVLSLGAAGMRVLGVVSVEYPAGETPRRFLRRVDIDSAEFRAGGDVYAVRGAEDTAEWNAVDQQLTIHLPTIPTANDTALVEVLASHDTPSTDSGIVTVPDAHLEAISSYCFYRACQELETDEAVTVDSSNVSIVLAQLAQTTRSAWNRYRATMNGLIATQANSAIATWNYEAHW